MTRWEGPLDAHSISEAGFLLYTGQEKVIKGEKGKVKSLVAPSNPQLM